MLIEHDVRPLDDLSVLGVLKLVLDLAVRTVTKENAFLGPQLKLSTIILRHKCECFVAEDPQILVIGSLACPKLLWNLKS